MMRKGIALLLLLIVMASMATGVYATWVYAIPRIEGKSGFFSPLLSVFEYRPEEILPDDQEANRLGQNHLDLITKILHEASYGLNATKKPIIHEELNVVGDVLYCEQKVQGGNLKHLMVDGTYAHNLLFQIEYVSETEYITYTYYYSDVKSNAVGVEIEVYKTVMKKGDNKKWDAPVSYKGVAKVMDAYKDGNRIRAIDSATFRVT